MADTKPASPRTEALREARADSLIEGLRESPQTAGILNAWTRGEIDGDEARRRLDPRLAAEPARGP